jgi:hypothetical protein
MVGGDPLADRVGFIRGSEVILSAGNRGSNEKISVLLRSLTLPARLKRVLMASWLPLIALACGLADAAPKPSPWLTDYAAARQLAQKTGKPILAVFR